MDEIALPDDDTIFCSGTPIVRSGSNRTEMHFQMMAQIPAQKPFVSWVAFRRAAYLAALFFALYIIIHAPLYSLLAQTQEGNARSSGNAPASKTPSGLAASDNDTEMSDAQAERLFSSANEAYKNADYKRAATIYEQLVHSGVESADVYFNLGNCYYKSGKIASAILNYHRAQRLDPTDDDIEFNLSLAESRIADKIDPAPQFFIIKWWRLLVGLQTASVWSATGVVFVWVLCIAAGVFFASPSPALRKGMFTTGILALVASALMFVFAYRQNKATMRDESAIVFASSVVVKSEPQEESKDLFVLHEGTHVEVLSGDGIWCKIRIPDGSVGWLRRNTIEVI